MSTPTTTGRQNAQRFIDAFPEKRFKRVFEWVANGNPMRSWNSAYVDHAGVP